MRSASTDSVYSPRTRVARQASRCAAVQSEAYQRYRDALGDLSSRDRELVVARIEAQWSVGEIAKRFEMPTPDAARMAVGRALKRLTTKLHGKKES